MPSVESIIWTVLWWVHAHRACTSLHSVGLVPEAGLNPYLCEIANLREHVSWVHEKSEATTNKAIDIVKGSGKGAPQQTAERY